MKKDKIYAHREIKTSKLDGGITEQDKNRIERCSGEAESCARDAESTDYWVLQEIEYRNRGDVSWDIHRALFPNNWNNIFSSFSGQCLFKKMCSYEANDNGQGTCSQARQKVGIFLEERMIEKTRIM